MVGPFLMAVKTQAVRYGIPALKYGGPAVGGYIVGRNKDPILSQVNRMTTWIGRAFTSKDKLIAKDELALAQAKVARQNAEEKLKDARLGEAHERSKLMTDIEASILEKVAAHTATLETKAIMDRAQIVSEVKAELEKTTLEQKAAERVQMFEEIKADVIASMGTSSTSTRKSHMAKPTPRKAAHG